MRILHIDTGKEWRGGQRQAFFLHEGLINHGYESRMVCHSDGELVKRAKNTIPLAFRSELAPSYIFKLIKIIKEFKPDIIHSHDSHSLTPCIVAATINSSFKLVHTRRVDYPLKKFFNKYKSKRVNLAAVAEAVRESIAASGIPKDRITKIFSGADKPAAVNKALAEEFRAKYNPYGLKVLGTVANFADQKDYPTLLKAFDKLYETRQDILLLAVGDGPLFEEMTALKDTLKSKNNIVFTGFSSNIPEMLSIMDLFTITSKAEGICSCLIDTMNAGLATVATRAGGIPELIQEGENGILFDVGDYEGLADGYNKLFSEHELRRQMEKTALERADNYSVARMVDSYIELYQKLLK